MDVEEAKEKKIELQIIIAKALHDFTRDSGIYVACVLLTPIKDGRGAVAGYVVNVEAKI